MKRALAGLALTLALASAAGAQDYRARLPQDEVIYFVLPDRFANGDTANDRGGLAGDRLATGYDPTDKGFYHGGDLKGLTARLDYIASLGATAVWVGPIFKNKPVQGAPGHESSGYHGYWITDFTTVDPHLGTDADFAALVKAAHARGLKVYMDIIVNHTADVIRYKECPANDCAYRSRADFPYQRGGRNPGFMGDAPTDQTKANFAHLKSPDFAYTPYVPAAEAHIKVPAWLNDPLLYHNRGNSTFAGESSTMGDFSGLDDLYTENPRVVAGFIEIFGAWIDQYKIDGFRIDTAQHVNPEFWMQFVPAMQARAKANGIANFHIFGEVFTDQPDVARLARHTRVDKLPSVLDFAFRAAVISTVAGDKGTDVLARIFADDPLYDGGAAAALQAPTFVSNHDAGRFGYFLQKDFPSLTPAEALARAGLANAMLLTLRGVPVIYSGDEQGFTGDGGDQASREDMFASRVASYNDNRLIGTTATTATDSYDTRHPLYRQIATLSAVRSATPALRRGLQVTRFAGDQPGLFAVSRFDPDTGAEVLLVFNTATTPFSGAVEIDPRTRRFTTLAGTCAATVTVAGSVKIDLPPLGYAICAGVNR